ncbi:MAG: hydrolase 2, exosortase A system-associated [Rhizobacter sp.]|nr:hydrolase 2, exosortase A system-associated [Rhizobacter sp.]
MTPHPEPSFLEVHSGPLGRRYVLYHAPHHAIRGVVVYVHPFAEEMNKARRMAAMQSRALATAGFAVLQIDLLGCGDSAGDSGDATWQQWVDDVVEACRWLREKVGATPTLWLWGLRAGCLLAAEAAQRLPHACNFLFWQPTPAGKPLLQQFLRLKTAGGLLSGQAKGVLAQLRAELAGGRHVEIAGYSLHPDLCAGLEQSTLRPPRRSAAALEARVEWFELSTLEGASLSPAASQGAAAWTEAGWQLRTHLVRGPSFWQTTEIEDAPELVAATLSSMAP